MRSSAEIYDFTNDGDVTMSDLAASGATEALVSISQAHALYTEMQQLVRFVEVTDREDGALRPRNPAWNHILIRTVAIPDPCPHQDVRYSASEKGAVACYVCGRLFGHLQGETFYAFNPR
jgi:hypothetical protein